MKFVRLNAAFLAVFAGIFQRRNEISEIALVGAAACSDETSRDDICHHRTASAINTQLIDAFDRGGKTEECGCAARYRESLLVARPKLHWPPDR